MTQAKFPFNEWLSGASLIRFKMKTLNTKDMEAWLSSYEGLSAQVEAAKWDISKCPEVWKQLRNMMEERADNTWKQSLELARKTSGGTEDEVFEMAERFCIDRYVYPPHWKTEIYCDSCGIMLSRNDEVGCLVCKFNKEINHAVGYTEETYHETIPQIETQELPEAAPDLFRDDSIGSSPLSKQSKALGLLPSLAKKNGGR